MENQGNLITTESTRQPTKLYTRRKFIGLGLIGDLGLTGGMSVIDKVLGEQANDKMSHKLVKPNFSPTPKEWSNNEVTIAWLGHASFLINFFGT